MKSWKDNVSFILVEPRKSGNIGASARALANMGFRRLELVNPPDGWEEEAKSMACGWIETLREARIHPGFGEAVGDKQLVVGTTRRRGKNRGHFYPFREGLEKIVQSAATNRVAVLFGREPSGLTNLEIGACNFMLTIPSDPASASLNLSQCVMLVAYELSRLKDPGGAYPWVDHEDLEILYRKIQSTLTRLGYKTRGDRDAVATIMTNIRKLIGRAGLTPWDLNMILGLCSRIETKIPSDSKEKGPKINIESE